MEAYLRHINLPQKTRIHESSSLTLEFIIYDNYRRNDGRERRRDGTRFAFCAPARDRAAWPRPDRRSRPHPQAQRHQRRNDRGARRMFLHPSVRRQSRRDPWRRPAFFGGARPQRDFRTGRDCRRPPLALLASLLREDRIWPHSGGRGAEGRRGRRRAGIGGGDACARRRTFGLLRLAGGAARNIRRRRRFGAAAPADRRRQNGGHDADRPDLWGRRGRSAGVLAISRRGWRGLR